MPGILPLFALIALLSTMLTGCSGSEGEAGEDNTNNDNDGTGNKNTENDVIEKIKNEVRGCEAANDQNCVHGALVQCTSALDETEAVHIKKMIDGKSIKVADFELLNDGDITRAEKFEKGCLFSPDKKCFLDNQEKYIEGKVWQDHNQEIKDGPDNWALNVNDSYMICNYGEGFIFFKDAGQALRNALSNEVDEIFGRTDNFADLSDDEILLVTTIYGEAGGCSEDSWKALANIIMNRIGTREWKNYTNPVDIIKNTGFDAYTNPNAPYRKAETYFKNRDFSDEKIEKLVQTVIPIFRGETEDTTNGCVLYYSPEAQKALHQKYPHLYGENPSWDFTQLEEVKISGTENDDFKFYKYK